MKCKHTNCRKQWLYCFYWRNNFLPQKKVHCQEVLGFLACFKLHKTNENAI